MNFKVGQKLVHKHHKTWILEIVFVGRQRYMVRDQSDYEFSCTQDWLERDGYEPL